MRVFLFIPYCVALVSTFGCSQTTRPYASPDQRGPFEVGLSTMYFKDPNGKSLVADVWYPAAPSDDAVLAEYEPLNVTGTAYRNPPIDLSAGPHPLVAFSHGYISIRFQSFYMMEHLASHGFVIVAPDHPHNTLFDNNPDMDVQMMLERPGDVIHSVNHLLAQNDMPGLFLNTIRDDTYAAIGHSFGAVTVMRMGGAAVDWDTLRTYCAQGQGNGRVCDVLGEIGQGETTSLLETDDRIITTVPMSPGLWYAFGDQGSGLAALDNPLVLAGEKDDILSWNNEGEPVWDAMKGPKRLALFHDVGHYGFSFLCEILTTFRPECAGPDDGWADLKWVHQRSQTIVTAHLQYVMNQEVRAAPWLDAATYNDGDRWTTQVTP